MHTTYAHYSSTLVVVRMHRYDWLLLVLHAYCTYSTKTPFYTREQGLEIRNASGTLDLSNRQDFCE